jgi:ion channel-forming bestrophin family protein
VSWRSAQSFSRYNEACKQWSTIVSTTRTFARLIWFNVPNAMPQYPDMLEEEQRPHALMEKKTFLNLIAAFAVATKHCLPQEDGIYYTDLYHLVKFLPAYSIPAGIMEDSSQHGMVVNDPSSPTREAERQRAVQAQGLPQPVTVRQRAPMPNSLTADFNPNMYAPPMPSPLYIAAPGHPSFAQQQQQQQQQASNGLANAELLSREDEVYLIPAYKPPRWAILQVWPFSLLRGRRIVPASKATGDRAKKIRAKIQNKATSHNLPLEISLYLGSYIAAHQRRGTNPVIINNLANNINQLVGALTSLERILTTPIPWSYHVHLWVLLCGYVALLPFQVVKGMGWYTIPGVILFAAVFFGFLTAAEELEGKHFLIAFPYKVWLILLFQTPSDMARTISTSITSRTTSSAWSSWLSPPLQHPILPSGPSPPRTTSSSPAEESRDLRMASVFHPMSGSGGVRVRFSRL